MSGLKVISSASVPDGRQVWMRGALVVDVTLDERAKFLAMFGLMRVPSGDPDCVMLSPSDYEALAESIAARREGTA